MPLSQTTVLNNEEFDIRVVVRFERLDRDRLRVESNIDLADAIDTVMDAAGIETGRPHEIELMRYEAVVPIAPTGIFLTEEIAQNIAKALLASEVESAEEQVRKDQIIDLARKLLDGMFSEDDADDCGDPLCSVHGVASNIRDSAPPYMPMMAHRLSDLGAPW